MENITKSLKNKGDQCFMKNQMPKQKGTKLEDEESKKGNGVGLRSR